MTELGSVLATLFIVGFSTLLLLLLLRGPQQPAQPRGGGAALQQPHRAGTNRRGGQHPDETQNNNNSQDPYWTEKPLQSHPPCTRTPSHLSTASAQIAHSGGANVLVDGLVAFRYTKAAVSPSSSSNAANASTPSSSSETPAATQEPQSHDWTAVNRKERARVLSRLLMDQPLLQPDSVPIPPPNKGGNVVASIPMEDVGCPKLTHVLYLLATYYNLMVVVAVEASSSYSATQRSQLIEKLRAAPIGDAAAKQESSSSSSSQPPKEERRLTADILPNHRILTASTIAGRVALTRQLQRVELVLEYDPQVLQNLARFGHRVISYTTTSPNQDGKEQQQPRVSMLGQTLV